jgi:RNA polymerase sigma-70 factor (ECF subfamily)
MEAPCHEADETALVESAANGDTDAFAQLFNRYYSMIHAFAYRLSLSGTDAEDIAQETFIKAARALPSFRRESSFKNWLYRIAVNTTEDFRRRSARQSRLACELEASAREIERPQDHARLTEALAALAADLRQAIVLVYYEGMNHADAARILGCAETTVSWRVFQAKRRMRMALEPSSHSVPGGRS